MRKVRLGACPQIVNAFLASILIVCLRAAVASAAVAPFTADQMVQLSSQVVVAVVERQQAHWNEPHTLIMTDYFLRVEERLRGELPDQVTLTMLGGTLAGETHETSNTVHLRTGSRYLLFCHDLKPTRSLTITGAWQGVFREIRGADGASAVAPGDGDGPPLADSKGTIRFADFVAAVRGLVKGSKAESGGVLPGWRAESSLPAKTYAPLASRPDAGSTRPPLAAQDDPRSPGAREGTAGDSARLAVASEAAIGNSPGLDYVYSRRPAPPMVFNQLPASFTPWSPNDQSMMAYWNVYANGLFRVYANPTGTWAWGNGVNDIAGFPSDADMVAQFGVAWSAGELAVTFSRWFGDGPIVESDVAVNPHYPWTVDDAFATQPGSIAWSFRTALAHELGHTWGLQHPWETQRVWWDSIMNYAPKEVRLPRLCSDDAAAARAAYPGLLIHDGLISSHTTAYNPDGSNQAFYTLSEPTTAALTAGASFQMTQPLTVENVGTDDLVNPVIEAYLTPLRLSFDHSVFLGSLQFTDTVHPFPNSIRQYSVGTLAVPAQTPAGQYAVAFWLRDNSDGLMFNNGAWTTTFIQVLGNSAVCAPDAFTACLLKGRFKATVRFRGDFTNNPADTQALLKPVTGFANASFETAFFYFNDPNNIELLLKMLDQGNQNAQGQLTIAVLFGSASPLRVELTITDTQSGAVRTYASNEGTLAGAADFVAFVK